MLIYAAGVFLGKAIAFVMLPIYTRHLTPADYGVLQLIDMTLEVASIMAGSRIAWGIFHFYYKASTTREQQHILSTALFLNIALFFAVALSVYVAALPISRVVLGSDQHGALIRIAAARFAFDGLVFIPLAYLRLFERSRLFVLVNATKLIIQLTLNIILIVYLEMGVRGVLISGLVANVVIGSALAGFLVRQVGTTLSLGAARALLRFGIPLAGTQIATFVATFSDRYFLRAMADISEVGLYGLAYQFGFLLAVIGYMPFNTAWDPVRFEIARRPDRDRLYQRAFNYLNILLVGTAVLIALFVGDVLRIMAAPSFHAAARVVPIILVAYILQSWTGMHNMGIMIRERTELLMLANWVAATVAVAGYVLLIPKYLGLGAAVATLVAFGLREWLVYRYSQRLWPIQYSWQPIIRVCAWGVVIFGISTSLPPFSTMVSVALHAGLFAVFVLGLLALGVLSHGDRMLLLRALRSPRWVARSVASAFVRPSGQ